MLSKDIETNHLWSQVLSNYFESHVRQRFLLVNYFIVIFSFLVVAAYFSHYVCLTSGIQCAALISLALAMTAVAFIFYFFEKRVKFFINRCQKRLIALEAKLPIDPDLMLFESEENETKKERTQLTFGYFFSYSKCINAIIIISLIVYIVLLLIIWNSRNSNCNNTHCEYTKTEKISL